MKNYKKNIDLKRTGLLPEFDLFETILWEKGRFFLLPLHKSRLEKSATHFSFPFPREGIDLFLRDAANSFQRNKKYRLKLILKSSGRINLISWAYDKPGKLPVKACFSKKQVDKNTPLLYHKTTKRSLYEEELAICRSKGFFDVIFTNTKNEVTEGAITNVLIKKGEEYFTPPVSCGLLPGTYRRHLFEKNDFPIKEKVLFKEDLEKCDELFLINSVRKQLPVKLKDV